MSGISHSTNQNRFLGVKLEWLSLPAIWPFKRSKAEQVETALQIFTEDQPLPPSRRLVVILPDANIDYFTLPRRIWNLASPDRRQVLLMLRPGREENESHARMTLTTLAAIIRDSSVTVQTQLVLGQPLVKAACQVAQPEDVLVCFEEHQVSGFLKKRWLAEVLAQTAQRPIYTLKGSVSEIVNPISARLVDFLLLAACLISLVVFFMLEVWIARSSTGSLQTVLQILAVCVEAWVIGKIASKTYRI